MADSYAGVDRLAGVRLTYKYETPSYFVESTPILGFAWHGESFEWTILDLFAAHIFGRGDFAYAGAGLGVHSLNVAKTTVVEVDGGYPYSYESSQSQSETTLTADVGVGLLALRTYDFSIVVDVRYHYVFAEFDPLSSKGAQGIALWFGTSR